MKKLITTLLMLMTVFAISCICVQAEDEIKVYVNDSQIVFDQAPIIVEDRTMVPIRAVCEALGADVYWDAENPSTVLVVKNDTKLWLEIDMAGMYVLSFANFDEFYAYANTIHLWGYKNKIETVTLDASPMIYNDRTLLPIRAVCEALGANVLWDAESKSVQIMHNIEFISDRNRDVEFFEKFLSYRHSVSEPIIYKHRGTIEISTASSDHSFDRKNMLTLAPLLLVRGMNEIQRIETEDGIVLEIEYADGVSVEDRITQFRNEKPNIEIKTYSEEIIFGTEELDSEKIAWKDINGETVLTIPFKKMDVEARVGNMFLYVNDYQVGLCEMRTDDSGTHLIIKKIPIDSYQHSVQYDVFSSRLASWAYFASADVKFTETPYEQFEKDLIIYVEDESAMDLGRDLAYQMERNFGVSPVDYKKIFENEYIDIIVDCPVRDDEGLFHHFQVKKGSSIRDFAVRADDAALLEEIKAAFSNLPEYQLIME